MSPERIILTLFAATIVCLAAYNCRTLILPNAVIIPGIAIGLALAAFFPTLHGKTNASASVMAAFQGLMLGAVVVYGILIVGKALFGRVEIQLAPSSKVILSQTALVLPDREMPYEEVFYRASDEIRLNAESVHLLFVEGSTEQTRSHTNVSVSLGPSLLRIGGASFEPSQISRLEATTDGVSIPREVVGFGLVKLVALIGVFLGWRGVLFTIGCECAVLLLSSLLSLALFQTRGQSIEAATPLCVASIAWILFRTQLSMASCVAILLGTIISIAVALWRARIGQ